MQVPLTRPVVLSCKRLDLTTREAEALAAVIRASTAHLEALLDVDRSLYGAEAATA
jgi:hypothetical protein